ncbi:MAG: response regulator, partial [Reyranellales bacterium]
MFLVLKLYFEFRKHKEEQGAITRLLRETQLFNRLGSMLAWTTMRAPMEPPVLAELPNPFGDQPPRILIVDDIPDNRILLSRRFERQGYQCAEADSGQGALAAIEGRPFDVVLLDVMMPDLDGLEVLRRIREKYSQEMLAVIMVTGRAESDDIVQALKLGANDYIVKPVDFAVALARVGVQAGRKRAEEKVRQANQALSRANDDLERRIAERTVELVSSNEQLRVAIAEAQAANQAKDEFLATMSHELRTPLNGLVAMSHLLQRTRLDDTQQKMTAVIRSSSDAMAQVVTDLLDALDLTTNELTLRPERVQLGDLMRQAAAEAQESAGAKGLQFRLDIEPCAESAVQVDSRRLQQVLGKLLGNAVKFADSGEVCLAVRRASAIPDMVIVEVRDTGLGIDANVLDQLFRPFHQAD